MKKFYSLIAGLFFALSAINATPDIAYFTFTVNNATNDVVFTNNSVIGSEPGNRKAYWSFGDGIIVQTPPLSGTQHHYQQAGVYNVCLKIYRYFSNTNDSVLSAQVCKTVILESQCGANFEYRDSLIVNSSPLRHLVKFWAIPSHTTQKPVTQICWTFGDGTDTCINITATTPPANLLSVTHNYYQQGPYNVCVRIKYQDGCISEKCKQVILLSPPPPPADSCKADFERIQLSGTTNPLQVAFKALPWHSANKKPQTICWTFGDGTNTCISYQNNYTGQYNIVHTYQQSGNYEVCVKIYYTGGCYSTKCKMIQVGTVATCSANFEKLASTSNNPLTAIFKAIPQNSQNKKPSQVCWVFGDGRDTCINYAENYTGLYYVSHNYSQPGNYNVCVKIRYYGGCEANLCRQTQIGPVDSCRADYETIPTTSNTPLTFAFKALPWHNNNKKPVKICWYFGDGTDTCINYSTTYTGLYNVIHHYNQPGQYNVCVKILYDGGCISDKCRPIIIPPPPPPVCSVGLFEISPSISSLERHFQATPVTNPPSPIVRICWNFGDGTDTCIMISATQPPQTVYNIAHRYPGPGTYNACVKVLFQNGCFAYKCLQVNIRPLTNQCGGFMIDSLTAPRTFMFRGTSIHNPNDEPLYFNWTFGDGSSATGREVTHSFIQGGNYYVCLLIKTRLGCETKICKPVMVPGTNQAILTLTPNPVINTLHVQFFSVFAEPVTIKVFNNTGVAVTTFTKNAVLGANVWDFNLSNLLPGMYSLVVQSPNQLASAVFIKQ